MRFQEITSAWLALGLTGCGALSTRPGQDFQVHLHDAGPWAVVSRVAPLELRFSVEGCEQFTVGLDTSTVAERRVRPLEPEVSGAGLLARVPVSWLAPEAGEVCLRDERQPHHLQARLSVHCDDDGRTLESAPFEFSYATAWRAFEMPAEVHTASVEDQSLLLLAGDRLERRTLEGTLLEEGALSPVPEPRSALLTDWSDAVHVWSRCASGSCGMSEVPQTSGGGSTLVPNSELVAYVRRGSALVGSVPLRVPGEPFALARDGEDRLVLLSESGRLLLHLTPGEEAVVVAQTEDRLVTPFAQTASGPVYLGVVGTGEPARLRDAEGSVVAEVQLPGEGEPEALFLSPDGTAWGLIRQGAVYVGRFGQGAVQLPTELAAGLRPPQVGLAWFDAGIAVHGERGVEVYDAAAPHTLRFRSEVPETTRVEGVVGAGAQLLVTTLHGVRILDAEGKVVGGADPLPCGLGPSLPARPAGADGAVLVSGKDVLLFKAD